jgi:hypothetical protein
LLKLETAVAVEHGEDGKGKTEGHQAEEQGKKLNLLGGKIGAESNKECPNYGQEYYYR